MPSSTINMGITKWSASDFFSHTVLATNWDVVDAHDHTAGKGVVVPTAGVADGAITTPKLGALAVSTAKLGDGAVTTPKLADGAVTVAKTGTGASGLAEGSFSARRVAGLTIPNGAGAVVVWDTEDWDISGWFNTATGLFTPQVAGIYRLSALAYVTGLGAGELAATRLRVNGVSDKWLVEIDNSVTVPSASTVLVEANGTTDTFGIFIAHGHATPVSFASGMNGYFHGELVGRS